MKKLIIIRGPGGSGKSTIAKSLAFNLRKVEPVALLPVDSFIWDISGRNTKFQTTYGALSSLLNYYLSESHSVIIDGILIALDENQQLKLHKLINSTKNHNPSLHVFRLTGSSKIFEEREHQKYSEKGWAFKESEFREWYKLVEERTYPGEIVIDVTDKTSEKVVEEIQKHL